MIQLILAAGYATRLAPLTDTTPKPLLPIAARPMLEHVLASTAAIGPFAETIVITNNKFATKFKDWLSQYRQTHPDFAGAILNDGTNSNDDRLGAIGDLALALERHAIVDDILVIAADNLFTGSLGEFGAQCRGSDCPILGVYDVGSLEAANRFGVVSTDKNGILTDFHEKPQSPQSTLIGIALYYYPASILAHIHRYLAEGNNPDQPGRLIQWLFPQMPVKTAKIPGKWLDIGSHASLDAANALFTGR